MKNPFSCLSKDVGESHFLDVIKSFGVVFGDIGTSPIYVLPVVFLVVQPNLENIFGVVSLILWSLILLVFLKYAWFAMSLSRKGEGGTIVLKELLSSLIKSKKSIAMISLLSFLGVSLFMGDGVITPAISILSAVEGLLLIPSLKGLNHYQIIFISSLICFLLFFFQKRGVEKVAVAFGPIMALWFFALSVFGLIAIISYPQILQAFNPIYGINFLFKEKFWGFLALSGIILCATGSEALYADMGQLGRKPIFRAWVFVFIALSLNYLGQGAFLIQNPTLKESVLFEMVYNFANFIYIPFLILSICSTVIASQAMISGLFSVVYQGLTTNVMPKVKVDFTSRKLQSQVYIGFINWVLLLAVLFVIFQFKNSKNLAAAYGLAATGTMFITSTLMASIFFVKKEYFKFGVISFLWCCDLIYFASTLFKIPHGGYWSIIIAMVPFSIILIYTHGQKKLYSYMRPKPIKSFLEEYENAYDDLQKINGTALFFLKNSKLIHPYVAKTIFEDNIIYDTNIFVSVVTKDDPFGMHSFFKDDLAQGLRVFEIHRGYMEIVDIEKILNKAGIDAQVMFYGSEEIVTKKFIWKIYSVIKHLSPTFVQFYKLPASQIHGIVTLVEI